MFVDIIKKVVTGPFRSGARGWWYNPRAAPTSAKQVHGRASALRLWLCWCSGSRLRQHEVCPRQRGGARRGRLLCDRRIHLPSARRTPEVSTSDWLCKPPDATARRVAYADVIRWLLQRRRVFWWRESDMEQARGCALQPCSAVRPLCLVLQRGVPENSVPTRPLSPFPRCHQRCFN